MKFLFVILFLGFTTSVSAETYEKVDRLPFEVLEKVTTVMNNHFEIVTLSSKVDDWETYSSEHPNEPRATFRRRASGTTTELGNYIEDIDKKRELALEEIDALKLPEKLHASARQTVINRSNAERAEALELQADLANIINDHGEIQKEEQKWDNVGDAKNMLFGGTNDQNDVHPTVSEIPEVARESAQTLRDAEKLQLDAEKLRLEVEKARRHVDRLKRESADIIAERTDNPRGAYSQDHIKPNRRSGSVR